jgi:hypothetical protein
VHTARLFFPLTYDLKPLTFHSVVDIHIIHGVANIKLVIILEMCVSKFQIVKILNSENFHQETMEKISTSTTDSEMTADI